MGSKRVLVELFYDTVSPYAYIGFENIIKCSKTWSNMNLQLRPIFLGGIMATTNNTPPGFNPMKAKYMYNDVPAKAKYFGVEMNVPKDMGEAMFSNQTLKPQRLLTVIKKEQPEKLESISRQFFRRIWVEDKTVGTPDNMIEACISAGVSAEQAKEWLSQIGTDEIKNKLKEATKEAVENGAYGAPAYLAHLESRKVMLFGCDQIYLLANYLNEDWDFKSKSKL